MDEITERKLGKMKRWIDQEWEWKFQLIAMTYYGSECNEYHYREDGSGRFWVWVAHLYRRRGGVSRVDHGRHCSWRVDHGLGWVTINCFLGCRKGC